MNENKTKQQKNKNKNSLIEVKRISLPYRQIHIQSDKQRNIQRNEDEFFERFKIIRREMFSWEIDAMEYENYRTSRNKKKKTTNKRQSFGFIVSVYVWVWAQIMCYVLEKLQTKCLYMVEIPEWEKQQNSISITTLMLILFMWLNNANVEKWILFDW